jgi:phage baseplate assembly protein W
MAVPQISIISPAADFYIGFSSLQFQYNKDLILTNINLIKQDLLNNIYTRPGERVMMTTWGTRIPDLIADPLDDTSIYIVEQDLTTVFSNDPRVQLLDMQVIPIYEQNTITAWCDVAYTYLNFSEQFSINITFSSGQQ